MKNKELRPDIRAKVEEWLGKHVLVRHFWRFDDTFIVIATLSDSGGNIYCLRIFPVGDSLELSQDNILYVNV